MSDLLTRERGYFTVLALHRDDIAHSLALHGPEYLRYEEDGEDADVFIGTDASIAVARSITDATMVYLARKLGDKLMDGGDFYECVAYLATPYCDEPK